MTDDLIERLRAEDVEAAENVIRTWALLGGGDEGQWPRYIALGIASATDELRDRIATQQEAIDELVAGLRDARRVLIDHLQYMKKPESAPIVQALAALLSKHGERT